MDIIRFLFEQAEDRGFSTTSFLFEDRISDAKKSLSSERDQRRFDYVMDQLPVKYAGWVAKQLSQTSNDDKIIDRVNRFDWLLNKDKIPKEKRNIEAQTINDLEEWLPDLYDQVEEEQKERQIKKERAKKLATLKPKSEQESNVIYNDGRYLVVQPHSTDAACYFGSGTKWCISADQENQFDNYDTSGAKFFIIIDKQQVMKDPYSKVAVAYTGNSNNDRMNSMTEIYDSNDHLHTEEDLYNRYPEQLIKALNTASGADDLVSSNKEQEIAKITKIPPGSFSNILAQLNNEEGGENSEKMIEYYINNATVPQLAQGFGDYIIHFQTRNFMHEVFKYRIENLSYEQISQLYDYIEENINKTTLISLLRRFPGIVRMDALSRHIKALDPNIKQGEALTLFKNFYNRPNWYDQLPTNVREAIVANLLRFGSFDALAEYGIEKVLFEIKTYGAFYNVIRKKIENAKEKFDSAPKEVFYDPEVAQKWLEADGNEQVYMVEDAIRLGLESKYNLKHEVPATYVLSFMKDIIDGKFEVIQNTEYMQRVPGM